MPPLSVYLDTNAASYVYQHPSWPANRLAAVRRALARECEGGRIRVIVSTSLVEELTGIGAIDPARYVRTTKFVLDLAGPSFLLPHNERVKAEVANAGRLVGRAAFLQARRRNEFRSHVMGGVFSQEVADAVRQQVASYERDMQERRDSIRDKLGSTWSSNTARWWDAALPQIDDWTLDYMRASKTILCLPDDETIWPPPRQLPTAWHAHAYFMARIALNVGQNRRVSGSDLYDQSHYANAAYADLMITDDRAFVETYQAIPDRPFALESFREFAERLGVAGP